MLRRTAAAAAAAAALAAGTAAVAEAAPDCEGVQITVGTLNPPFIGGPKIAHARTWEQRTRGRANGVTFPFGELYPKFMTPMAADRHAFDVMMHAPAWLGDFAPYLSEMPASIRRGQA
jgi:multiple sugar transport system substrate-binding protein